MPELAEVEFYRKQWDPGLGQRVVRVSVHASKRIFRGTDAKALTRQLPGSRYRESFARGKQILCRFGSQAWIGIHLGMTGKLRTEQLPFRSTKHDHLVITLKTTALVFRDPRQFGRVHFHQGAQPPDWWTKIPPAPTDRAFTQQIVAEFLSRHRRLSIKATLLLQKGFPGIGNWMADEILWQSGIAPARRTAQLSAAEVRRLWTTTRNVCQTAMRTISRDFSDPPSGWLFHQRWSRKGLCPRHKTLLNCAIIGGRTTVWCAKCQPS